MVHISEKIIKKSSDKFSISQMRWDEKESRIRRQYPQSKVDKMLIVERAYANDDGSFRELFKALSYLVNAKAGGWARRTWYLRLTKDDYASVLWERAYHVVEQYDPSQTEYLLYETVKVALERAAINLYRHATTGQQSFERSTIELKEKHAWYIATDAVDDKLMVQTMLTSDALTDDEQRVLRYIYEHPSESLRDVSQQLGYTNHNTLRRQLDRIRRKLQMND